MSPKLKGFYHPLSPEGKAQLLGGFPMYIATAVMAINYKADPANIRKVLPEYYEPSKTEPDLCSCWFGDWLLVTEADKDIIAHNPERAQYKECAIHVRCRVKGVEARLIPYLWVDKDFALIAGLHWGFPKKLGNIHLGHSNRHLFELNKAIGKFGTGTRIASFIDAHGERLVTGSVKLSRKIEPGDLPPLFGTPHFNIIHWPPPHMDSSEPLVHKLVRLDEKSVWFGEAWAAEDASLIFSESALEEHTAIKPIEVTGAYYVEVGILLAGFIEV